MTTAISLTGVDIEDAIGRATPLVNPRLSEVNWDDVANHLFAHVQARVQAIRSEHIEYRKSFGEPPDVGYLEAIHVVIDMLDLPS